MADSGWFWTVEFWLPPGVTWDDLEKFENDGHSIAHAHDLIYVPIYALLLIVVRIIFERFIGVPFAAYMGVKNKVKQKPETSEILESEFRKYKKLKADRTDELLKELGSTWDERRVERWYRHRRNQTTVPIVSKFCETLWRFTFYTLIYFYACGVMYNSTWFWDQSKCWEGYPMQDLYPSTKIYYLLELSFYLALLFTIFTDVKRKDFTEQVIHHFATISLIALSYAVGFTRIGTIVMWCHDISDIFLEGAKICVYSNINKVADILFICFGASFFVSRLIFYPGWILHTTWVKSMWLYNPFPGYYLFNALLLVLQFLHIFWFYLIIKMAIRLVSGNQVEDSRSDYEDDDEQELKKE